MINFPAWPLEDRVLVVPLVGFHSDLGSPRNPLNRTSDSCDRESERGRGGEKLIHLSQRQVINDHWFTARTNCTWNRDLVFVG